MFPGKLISNFTYVFGRYLCRNRKRRLHSALGQLIKGLYFSYENHNYHFSSNGELFLIKALSQFGFKTIFDVGANVGSWTKSALQHFQQGQLYSFEVIPDTFKLLKSNVCHSGKVRVYNFGFGKSSKTAYANFVLHKSSLSSLYSIELPEQIINKVEVRIEKLDDFCSREKITKIDFLKIDTEGMDYEVLQGASSLLNHGNIKVIQFEYGLLNIQSGTLLKDFYLMLNKAGYTVGKLYPTFVDFGDYKTSMENFMGPNYIAIHETQKHIIHKLKG